MAVPKPKQFATPSRSISEFTVGNSDNKPDLSTAATSVNVGGITQTPAFWQILSTDSQIASFAVAAQTTGTQYSVSQVVGFPNLTTPFSPSQNDSVFLWVSANSYSSIIGGQLLLGTVITPRGHAGTIIYTGPNLNPGVTYTSLDVLITVYLYAVAATSGGTYQIRLDALLLDLPG